MRRRPVERVQAAVRDEHQVVREVTVEHEPGGAGDGGTRGGERPRREGLAREGDRRGARPGREVRQERTVVDPGEQRGRERGRAEEGGRNQVRAQLFRDHLQRSDTGAETVVRFGDRERGHADLFAQQRPECAVVALGRVDGRAQCGRRPPPVDHAPDRAGQVLEFGTHRAAFRTASSNVARCSA
ncbi:hypothetical protein MTP03_43230 [Tsukamurella sp. PLM1]|nr:hypothetical protein MTP03_43230 [Tsukamurella sp. PLM1]